jgi:hypothetical protein
MADGVRSGLGSEDYLTAMEIVASEERDAICNGAESSSAYQTALNRYSGYAYQQHISIASYKTLRGIGRP